MIKAVIFDIGQTLIEYDKPLNWSKLTRPAFEYIADTYGYHFTEQHYQHACNILTKYNTRVYPREYEVSSTQIFTEILDGINVSSEDLEQVKSCFYSYFRKDARPYPDAEATLKLLSDNKIVLGTLSDVAYGMDNVYALEDIASLIHYIEYPITSNDVGYRKPSARGLKLLSEKMNIPPCEMAFVGDEEKDIICAIHAGVYSVLINRDNTDKNFGQDAEIHALSELPPILNLV